MYLRIAPLVALTCAACGTSSDAPKPGGPETGPPFDATVANSCGTGNPHALRFQWAHVWPKGVSHDDVVLGEAGDVVLTGLFTGSVDFDPTSGTDLRNVTSGQRYFTRIKADGTYGFAVQLSPLLDWKSFAVAKNGDLVLAGLIAMQPGVVDFDPTTGEDKRAVATQRMFVTRILASGAYGGTSLVEPSNVGPIRFDTALNALVARGPTAMGREGVVKVSPSGVELGFEPLPYATVREPSGPNGEFSCGGGGRDGDPTFGVDVGFPQVLPSYVGGGLFTYCTADGVYEWGRFHRGPLTMMRLGFDPAGDLYALGSVQQPSWASSPIVVEVDYQGGLAKITAGRFLSRWSKAKRNVWTQLLNAEDMVVDRDAVLTTRGHGRLEAIMPGGDVRTPRGPSDILVQALSLSNGFPKWTHAIGGDGSESPQRLRLNAAGALLVTGVLLGKGNFDPELSPTAERVADETIASPFVAMYALARGVEESGCASPPAPVDAGVSDSRKDAGCKITCAELGAECGTVSDGCGGMQNCGVCPSGHTCGSAGGKNTCAGLGAVTPVASDLAKHPNAIALDATDVYFTTRGELGLLDAPAGASVSDAGDIQYTRAGSGGGLHRVARAGGAPSELASGKYFPRAIALAKDHVLMLAGKSSPDDPYVFTGASLLRVPKTGGVAIEIHARASARSGVSIDGSDAFFFDQTLMRVPVDGSSSAVSVVSQKCIGGHVTFDAEWVYFTCLGGAADGSENGVWRVKRDGTSLTEIVRGSGSGPLAVDATSVYFTSLLANSVDEHLGVWRVAKAALRGTPIALAQQTNKIDGQGWPPSPWNGLALKGDRLYFHEWGDDRADTDRGALKAVPVTGGDVVTVMRGLNHPSSLATDGSTIVLTELGRTSTIGALGRVLRTP